MSVLNHTRRSDGADGTLRRVGMWKKGLRVGFTRKIAHLKFSDGKPLEVTEG